MFLDLGNCLSLRIGRINTIMGSIEGMLVDPINESISPARVHCEHGKIVAIDRLIDAEVTGKPFLLPGFVDAHVHVESSMVPPVEFARAAVLHGTVAAVSDPHEIANVLGLGGVEFMLDEATRTPFEFCFGAPSCVPATGFETSGAILGAREVAMLLDRPDIGYLAEVMNFPGVIAGDPDLLAKIRHAIALGKPVDGHCPGLSGAELEAYAAAGITTDHECSRLEEALEKIDLEMKILIREGSAARNFETLAPLLLAHPEQCMFCSDDKHPDALLTGHINRLVARAVDMGFDLFAILRAASWNPVQHYRLKPPMLRVGDDATFLLVENLRDFAVRETWIAGALVARDGECLLPSHRSEQPNRFHSRTLAEEDFRLAPSGKNVRVIEVDDGQLITRAGLFPASSLSDPDSDVLKLCVVNRYHDAPPALAYARHIGLRRGALASTVAHDCHNIVAVGASDRDLCRAVNALMETRGGCVAVDGDRIEVLPLPIAGLMSPEPIADVAAGYARLTAMARSMGSGLEAPFMTLSFLALLVIPSLKLSDRGLFDGEAFRFVSVFD